MKKYLLSLLVLLFTLGCSDHDHDHDHDHGHSKSESLELFSDNEYLTNLNLMKGHLWVGVELYKANYFENAKKHMKHPKSELYGDIIPTFNAKGAKGFASELENLALSVENEESLSTINQNYQNLFEAIHQNELFVDEENKSIDKKILLAISILEVAAEEYAIGIVNGEVKNKFEYQDALGFTKMARVVLENIVTDEKSQKIRLSKMLEIIDSLFVLWPELVPINKVDGDSNSIKVAIEKIKNF